MVLHHITALLYCFCIGFAIPGNGAGAGGNILHFLDNYIFAKQNILLLSGRWLLYAEEYGFCSHFLENNYEAVLQSV
jgi:hypothetical protein